MKEEEEKMKLTVMRLETALSESKLKVHQKISELKEKDSILYAKDEEIERLGRIVELCQK